MNEKGIGIVVLSLIIIVLLIIGAFALSMVIGEAPPATVQSQNVTVNETNTIIENNT